MKTLLDSPVVEILEFPISRIVEPFQYETDDGLCIKIPKGFITDGASIPRIFSWIIYNWGDHANAAVIHDYICRYQLKTRKECDKIFLEAMEELGVSSLKRKTMYYFVRVFGAFSWGRVSKRVRKYSEKMSKVGIELNVHGEEFFA